MVALRATRRAKGRTSSFASCLKAPGIPAQLRLDLKAPVSLNLSNAGRQGIIPIPPSKYG